MRTFRRYYANVRWMVLLALVATVVGGCGASRSAPAPAGAAESAVMEEAPAEMADGVVAQAGESAGGALPRKVVAKARMELIIDDAEVVYDEIVRLMDEVGGYVSAANLYKSNYSGADLLQGTLTLRVPAEHLESVMGQLEVLAVDVRSRNVDRQDVTDQYSDIEAQLRNLEATEKELRELLAEVRERPNATPEDILAVFRSLTEIRGQIEELQGRKNMLDNLISLSTIDVTLTPDAANRPVVEDGWRPAVVVRDALRTLLTALQGLASLAIWVGIFLLPLLLLALAALAVLFWIARLLLRGLSRRRQRVAPAGERG